jgi:HSP20 family protein
MSTLNPRFTFEEIVMNNLKEDIPVTGEDQASEKASWPALKHPILEMEHAFDRFFGHDWAVMRPLGDFFSFNRLDDKGFRTAYLDLVDRDNEIFVRAEVPGLEKKDIKISLSDNLLTIKGASSLEKKEEKGDYHRHEITSSSFSRSVMLPVSVEPSKALATLKDGVLEITLPKLEASKLRNIEVT